MPRRLLMLLAGAALFAGCARSPSDLPETAGLNAAQDASVGSAKAIAKTGTTSAGRGPFPAAAGSAIAQVPPTAPLPPALRPMFEACADAADDVDTAMRKCIDSEFAFQDARLNTAYAALGKTLAADHMTRLRNRQREWIVDRDRNCAWDTGIQPEAQPVQAGYCRLDTTASRANELESMLSSDPDAQPGGATRSTPVEANAVPDDAGRMTLKAGDIRVELTAPGCRSAGEALLTCNDNVALSVSHADGSQQTLRPAALYLNARATLYRGPLAQRGQRESQSIVVADFNADGIDDLALCTGMRGGYGGASYDVYQFNAGRKSYVASPAFSNLTVGTDGFFQIIDGRIRTSAKSGCCIHTESIYVVQNNSPKLVEQTALDSSSGHAKPTRTVFRLLGGEMRSVGD